MDIKIANGEHETTVKIMKIPAMDAWEIQRQYTEFVLSKDPDYRKQFTMRLLAFAVIKTETGEIPLATSDVINNHLGNWKNLKEVFDKVLSHNGIDPETHAEKQHYWSHAGAEMAAAFITESVRLIGPLLKGEGE